MYDFIVLTAAITRPDLHTRLLPGHLAFIGAASVKWLINVDDAATAHSAAETIANFERLLAPARNVDLEVLEPPTPPGAGCFFSAATRLATRAHELLAECRVGVVWLEDDWIYRPKHPVTDALTQLRLRLARNRAGKPILRCGGTLDRKRLALEEHESRGYPLWFVSLVPRSRVSFNPGIWSKAMFEQGMRQRLAQVPAGRVNDPETVCADPFNEASAYRLLSVFVDPLFQDAGRRWSVQHGLTKWLKLPSVLGQQGAVTYRRKASPASPAEDLVERPSGFFLCPDLLADTPLVIIGRIRRRSTGVEAAFVWVPSFSFDLHFTDSRNADVYLNRPLPWSRTYPYKETPVRLTWSPGESGSSTETVTLATSRRTVTATLKSTLPHPWVWLLPVQALAGIIVWIVTAVRVVIRLDSE